LISYLLSLLLFLLTSATNIVYNHNFTKFALYYSVSPLPVRVNPRVYAVNILTYNIVGYNPVIPSYEKVV